MARTTVDLPWETWPMVPTLMVAWREMTAGWVEESEGIWSKFCSGKGLFAEVAGGCIYRVKLG